jgi:uncharacterized membrane protein (DUF2068 family)
VTPAAEVESLDGPLLLGIDLPAIGESPPWRLSRCLRCDAWVAAARPQHPEAERLPPPAELEVPARGRALRSEMITKLIALERGLHAVFFFVVAGLAIALLAELSGVKSWVRSVLDRLSSGSNSTGDPFGGSFLIREGNHLLRLRSSTLVVVIVIAVVYCVLEAAESVGLWRGRRWAEYLTVVATIGFVPYEIWELTRGVSVLKAAALIANLAVVAYLLWSKSLFGLGRIRGRRSDDIGPDPAKIFTGPDLSRGVTRAG